MKNLEKEDKFKVLWLVSGRIGMKLGFFIIEFNFISIKFYWFLYRIWKKFFNGSKNLLFIM